MFTFPQDAIMQHKGTVQQLQKSKWETEKRVWEL